MTMVIRKIIEIVAPDKLLNFKNEAQIETTTGDIVRCECCNGQGGKYLSSYCLDFDPNINKGDGYYQACKMCKGSGLIQPFVSVEWISAGFIRPEYRQNKTILTIDEMPSGVR